jgi:hypothetical protein
MARIELSQSTLAKIREAIKKQELGFIHNDLHILIIYTDKNITVRNKLTGQKLETTCRDRRLIFKYFEK